MLVSVSTVTSELSQNLRRCPLHRNPVVGMRLSHHLCPQAALSCDGPFLGLLGLETWSLAVLLMDSGTAQEVGKLAKLRLPLFIVLCE